MTNVGKNICTYTKLEQGLFLNKFYYYGNKVKQNILNDRPNICL